MKILLADDNPGPRKAFQLLAKYWGYDLDTVYNGGSAVKKSIETRYDLCLMDIEMPVMNGLDATRLIRCNLKKYYLPIMALTAKEESERRECFKAGMDDFVEKLYDIHELKQKIIELTVKSVRIKKIANKIRIIKEMPVDKEQLEELKELRKKGLGILTLKGGEQRFVVHKNIQNRMSEILIGEGKELFEFLDRSENLPANCHLYKCNMQVNRFILLPEEIEEKAKSEDKKMEQANKTVDQSEKD